MSFRAEFRHPLVGWRNAVEEPALGRSREAGFSTAQDCPRADNLAALEMTEEVFVSLYCAIFSSQSSARIPRRPALPFADTGSFDCAKDDNLQKNDHSCITFV